VRGAAAVAHLVEGPGEWLEAIGARLLSGAPRPVVDAPRWARRPHGDERLADRVALEVGCRLGHVVAEVLAELRRVLDRAHAVGVHGHAGRSARGERDAQESGLAFDLFEIEARGRWRGVG